MGARKPVPADDVTNVPALPPEPPDPVAEPQADQVADEVAEAGRRRPRKDPELSDLGSEPEPDRSERVTQAQLVRAFYWAYRGWCRLLGAQVDAHYDDFEDLGKAWLDLARKVPGIRWVLAAVGPIFTLTDLIDKMARAWDVRTRLRRPIRWASWRQRPQDGSESSVHVVDGGTGAP